MLIVALFKGQKLEPSHHPQPCAHTQVLLPARDGGFVLMQKESLSERKRHGVVSRTSVRVSVGKRHEAFAAL